MSDFAIQKTRNEMNSVVVHTPGSKKTSSLTPACVMQQQIGPLHLEARKAPLVSHRLFSIYTTSEAK